MVTRGHTTQPLFVLSMYQDPNSRMAASIAYQPSEGYTVNAGSEGYRLFISTITNPGPAPSTTIKVLSSSRLRSRSTPLSVF